MFPLREGADYSRVWVHSRVWLPLCGALLHVWGERLLTLPSWTALCSGFGASTTAGWVLGWSKCFTLRLLCLALPRSLGMPFRTVGRMFGWERGTSLQQLSGQPLPEWPSMWALRRGRCVAAHSPDHAVFGWLVLHESFTLGPKPCELPGCTKMFCFDMWLVLVRWESFLKGSLVEKLPIYERDRRAKNWRVKQ